MSRKIRVVHLTSVHSPFDVRIFHKECMTLSAFGYDVVLVAPHQKIEMTSGIRIEPIKKTRNRLDRFVFSTWRIFSKALKVRGDIYHFHDPELMLVGFLLKILGKRVIYDVHEDVPKQILEKGWIPKVLRRPMATAMSVIERVGNKFFDGIVAATPSIAEKFSASKTVTLQNFPLSHEINTGDGTEYESRPKAFVYVGSMCKQRGLLEIGLAIKDVSGAKLWLVGEMAAEVKKGLAESLQIERMGWRGRDEVQTLLRSCRAGLITFHPVPNHVEAMPNKLFEYMAAGLPVIASDFPLWRELIEQNACGLLVNPCDPKSISNAMHWILSNPRDAEKMGQRGQEAVQKLYNWNSQKEKMRNLYSSVIAVHKP